MIVRRARPSDIAVMREIEARSDAAAHWTAAEYAALFLPKAALRIALVADIQTTPPMVPGFLIARCLPDEWEIENIAVARPIHRRGVATKLVQALIELARPEKVSRILLEVRQSNLPAKRLYEKNGFTMVGRRPLYYLDPPEDALLFEFRLHDRDISP
jgi:[ribosomal protein S18]-alanine N-acetyltransferase